LLQNLTTFSRKKNYKKNLQHIDIGFNFGQFFTFWIHHLLFGEFLSPNFNLKNVIFDIYKLQTTFYQESGPNILDFEGGKNPYHQIDGWIIFFKTLTSTVKPKAAKKKNHFWMILTLTTQIW
jgi:hypothetical protein